MSNQLITPENAIPINDARKHLPGHPSITVIYRMMNERGLPYVKVGRRRYTSPEAIRAWVHQQTRNHITQAACA